MIGFAHRGAPATGMRENTIAAFTNALEHGARALESDVWLAANGVPVLVHDGVLRSGLRRRPITAFHATELPSWLPTLDAFYDKLGTDFEFSLDVKDPAAALSYGRWRPAGTRQPPDSGCARTAGQRASNWRSAAGAGTSRGIHHACAAAPDGPCPPNRRIDEAAEAGADALNLRAPEWSASGYARATSRNVAFAWDVQLIRPRWPRHALLRLRRHLLRPPVAARRGVVPRGLRSTPPASSST